MSLKEHLSVIFDFSGEGLPTFHVDLDDHVPYGGMFVCLLANMPYAWVLRLFPDLHAIALKQILKHIMKHVLKYVLNS